MQAEIQQLKTRTRKNITKYYQSNPALGNLEDNSMKKNIKRD